MTRREYPIILQALNDSRKREQCNVLFLAPLQTRPRPHMRRDPLHVMPLRLPQNPHGLCYRPQGPWTGSGV